MAKFVGEIGFSLDSSEVPDSGIVVPEITEIKYHGDIMNATYKWNDNSKINEDLNISNKFSVVANSFAIENIGRMLYVKWNGVKWKIITAELAFPRITLYVGGLYNA
jgi:hypothetical protein